MTAAPSRGPAGGRQSAPWGRFPPAGARPVARRGPACVATGPAWARSGPATSRCPGRPRPPLFPRAPPRRSPRCACMEQPPPSRPRKGGPPPAAPAALPAPAVVRVSDGTVLGSAGLAPPRSEPRGCPRCSSVANPGCAIPSPPASRTGAAHPVPGTLHPSRAPSARGGYRCAAGRDRQVELPDRQTARGSRARAAHPPSAQLPPGPRGPTGQRGRARPRTVRILLAPGLGARAGGAREPRLPAKSETQKPPAVTALPPQLREGPAGLGPGPGPGQQLSRHRRSPLPPSALARPCGECPQAAACCPNALCWHRATPPWPGTPPCHRLGAATQAEGRMMAEG